MPEADRDSVTESSDHLKAALADRYRIERQLGAGGMATVYLAEDVKHDRKVAIKVLKPELAAVLGAERFVQEIKTTASLQHPHILPLFDSGEADSFLYYVMPYIEGETLREKLNREKQLGIEEAVKITTEVADALDYAHRQDVIHRDIKPENILLSSDHAMVADFGIAKAVSVAGGEQLTETGLAVGTPAYMSPEQGGGTGQIDGRSDVYGLGCVFYEMLTGEPPFTGASAQAVLAKHALDTVSPVATVRSRIPPQIDRAIAKALAKARPDRFATAREFADTLGRASREEPTVARRRVLAHVRTALTAGIVLLIAAAGWFGSKLLGQPSIERFAVLQPVNLMNQPEQEFFVQGMHDALITELGRAGMTVVGRQSVIRYRNTDTPIRTIARDLAVEAVLESSVFWVGDTVSIEARLIDGASEDVLWSRSYGNDTRHVIRTIRDLTAGIARELRLALTPQAEARLASAAEIDAAAYEAFLKGEQRVAALTPSGLDAAMRYYEEALQIDSTYAPAHAGIARVWGGRQQMGLVAPYVSTPLARAAAMKALELDSTVAEVHSMLAAMNAWHTWDWEAAEAEFRRAIELDPSSPRTHAVYSHFLNIMGRADEAMAQIDTALNLDPYDLLVQSFRAIDLLMVRRYDESLEQAREVLRAIPNHPLGLVALSQISAERGLYEEALNATKTLFGSRGDGEVVAALERGHAEAGYAGATRLAGQTLVARAETTYVAPAWIFKFYLAAGMPEAALDWMERGFDARDPSMPYIGVIPAYEQLRGNPRYEALLRRLRLPQARGLL
jgi:serine/threonine-protein kinase